MPRGAEMDGSCVTATFLGFRNTLHILVAESQQGWDKRDQHWGHGHRKEGTSHLWTCWVSMVPMFVGSIPLSPSLPERWECVTLALRVPWDRKGM